MFSGHMTLHHGMACYMPALTQEFTLLTGLLEKSFGNSNQLVYLSETPYNGYYSFHAATIVADGKLYTYSSEHTPSQPITRGWNFFCINATTGEEVWHFAGSGIDSRRFRGCAADGYLTVASSYDGMMYVFGKGLTSTTVTASPKVTGLGASVLIEGKILDQSVAQPNTPLCI